MSKLSLKQKREIARRQKMGYMQAYMEDLRKSGYSFHPTSDDSEANNWYPNFPGNLLAVSLIHWEQTNEWGIVVCGADDTGAEFHTDTEENAKRMLKSLPVVLSKQDLRERGFKFY